MSLQDAQIELIPVFPESERSSQILRVLMVNPLAQASRLTIVKILSGIVFGRRQLIDLTLLVYSNEKHAAEGLQLELTCCAFPCTNKIVISSDLPSLSDADVFCIMTDFPNPNFIEVSEIDNTQFDNLYLIIKIANNLTKPRVEKTDPKLEDKMFLSKKKVPKSELKPIKPMVMADGLIALDIMKTLSKDLPHDIFFCFTPHTTTAKTILGDHLKVKCNSINDVLVWAANDQVFHIEVEKPLLVTNTSEKQSHCDWDGLPARNDVWADFNHDHTQFSPAWLKKDFIEKVASTMSKNPYGCIYKAAEFSRVLQTIWKARIGENGITSHCSIGVISDGASGTTKGSPYVLPLVLSGDSWTANTKYDSEPHLMQELKRIKKTVKEFRRKFIPFCKKFLEDNVINQAFVPADAESESIYSLEQSSRSSNIICL